MGKKNEPLVHEDVPEFEIGRAQTLQEGADVCLIASGNIVPSVIDAAKGLRDHGLAATVINMHTIKPLDEAILTDVFARFLHVFTVEEHGIAGGLGGGVAEWAAGQADRGARLVRLGTRDAFMYEAGEQDHAREFFGLSVDQIQESILKELQL
jgi:transketolase